MESVVISSIRINKELSRRLDLAARKEGVSKAEIIRRALDKYLSKIIDEKPKSASDVLKRVEARAGKKPRIVKEPSEIFREDYRLEDLL